MISNSKKLAREKALRGVLTHEFFDASRRIFASLFFIALIFAGNNFAQETQPAASSGILDPTFDTQISTTSYLPKEVGTIVPLPGGKTLVAGKFNSYNGTPVGSVVRLNADGSLDQTFINDTIADSVSLGANSIYALAAQPDGKILVGGEFTLNGETAKRWLVRLNTDGSLDTTFSFNIETGQYGIRGILVRANGKILVSGPNFTVPNGVEGIIQLNSDGSLDSSFDGAVTRSVLYIEFQNDKLLVITSSFNELSRLNEDGSFDTTFNRRNTDFYQVLVQPDGKIIARRRSSPALVRLTVNGSDDPTFQPLQQVIFGAALRADGSIVTSSTSNPFTVSRLLPNGAPDSSFAPYSQQGVSVYSLAVQADGKVLIGDQTFGLVSSPINYFLRLNADGTRDTSFNTGTGFQLLAPGKVEAFAVQPDNKVIIGGRFDLIGNASHFRIARLNEDGTPDNSFQISRTAANRFGQVFEIYHLAVQSDGKIMVSGTFTYFVNGVTKHNIARLNPDGSIDSSYNLSVIINNYGSFNYAGKNKIIARPNNKSLIGASHNFGDSNPTVPIVLNEDGSRFNGFTSAFKDGANYTYLFDIFVQPDNKIVIGGKYRLESGVPKSFLARLNADGSVDSTFNVAEEVEKVVKALVLLADGKILVGKAESPENTPDQEKNGQIVRLKADGSADATFKAASINGSINALVSLGDGKILVGGAFTQINNQPRQNLAVLNADGTLNETLVNVNQEVLSLALDNQGRVLVGGAFTTINTGEGNVNRSYLARLVAEPESSSAKPRFDFDGDGRSDLALFNPVSGVWTIRSSRTNQTVTTHFGTNGDITVPADYDNDGKTDIAVYRPSQGMWYLQQSTAGFKAVRWGAAEDKPVVADYDGDGLADVAVFRPSSRIWYILQSSDSQLRAIHFGLSSDVILREVDFDGDGRHDIAVYRPSNGGWYWQASGSNNEFKAAQWGASGDIPVPADYNGDGKTDIAVYRPSDGVWYQQLSTESGNYNFAAVQFGLNGDVPIVGDYNGDGKADVSIRRGEVWALLLSNQGYTGLSFGSPSDKPVAAIQQ